MRVWLDDARELPFYYDVRVRTAHDAIALLKTGLVTAISLDHDLGETDNRGEYPGTGYDVAVFIEEAAFKGELGCIEVECHSASPVGKERIEAALKKATEFWEK